MKAVTSLFILYLLSALTAFSQSTSYVFATPVKAQLLDQSGLYISATPGYSFSTGYLIPKGTTVLLVGKRNAFYRVIYKNLLGYVSYSVIDKTYEAFKATEYEHEPLIGIAKFPFELQSQPITNSQTKMLVTVPKDSLLPIKEHNEVYYKTTYKSIEGYAAKSYLNLTGDESDETYLRKYPKIKVAQTAPEEVEAYPTRNRTHSRQYYRGPRGGCYYITASGRKQYVDRSLCK